LAPNFGVQIDDLKSALPMFRGRMLGQRVDDFERACDGKTQIAGDAREAGDFVVRQENYS
jgi:hypothetical protein